MNDQGDNKYSQSLAARLMPTQPKQVALLNQRAQELAKPVQTESLAEGENEYLKFTLNDNKCYGVLKHALNEVIYAKHVLSVPGVPFFIAGVSYWQDRILSVLDTNYLCTGQTHQEINDLSRIIVVGNGDKIMGLLVGSVDDYCAFKTSEITPLSSVSGPARRDCFIGILANTTLLLNIDKLMTDTALIVNE